MSKKQAGTKVEFTSSNINSKKMLKRVNGFIIGEGLNLSGLDWNRDDHRESFINVVNQFMNRLLEDDEIEQYKAFSNKLNNTPEEMKNGNYTLTVRFKQKHCLNTSEIIYKINASSLP